MKASKLLIQDHRTVKGLFRKFEQASRNAEKQSLAEQIIEELSVHALLEEQLVYPVLRQAEPRLLDPVLEALEEHHAAKLTLAELDKMTVDDERYAAKMKVVREAVEMHIAEEEKELLPRLDQLLSEEQDEALEQALVATRTAAPNHPHPMAPDTPPGNFVGAVFAKVLDIGKDLVRTWTNRAQALGHRRVAERAQATFKAVMRKAEPKRVAEEVKALPLRAAKVAKRSSRRSVTAR